MSAATATATTTPTETALPTGTWKVDPVHSSVEFQVKHLGIATVEGQFKEFEGTRRGRTRRRPRVRHREGRRASTRASPSATSTCARPTSSRSRTYPTITFASTADRAGRRGRVEIDGDLTIHGVTRPITLKAELEGTETDPQGNDRVGLSASAQINRSDYEMKFNAALGSGNVVVSDKVKILLDISAVKAA